jgi:predicted transcriptional regulator
MSSNARHTELVTLRVREVMSQPVLAIGADAPLGEALSALIRTGLRHLVVIDADARCLGVIADRAVAAAWALDPAALECATVRHILDRRPSVVGGDATVGDVAQAMHTDGVDSVAVIDRTGQPIGMITGGDLVALIARIVPGPITEARPETDVTAGDQGPGVTDSERPPP